MERLTVSITTDGSGNGSATLTPTQAGFVRAIAYNKDGVNPYADGVTLEVAGAVSGIPILIWTAMNATGMRYPRAATSDVSGVASLYAAAGEPVEDLVPVCNEQIQLTITLGGATNIGEFHIWIG